MKKTDEIKVSVIIYVKNTVDYIEKCIRSVMNQTLQEIEILIVDGGSTDGTLDIIERVKKEDNRIRFFHSIASVGAQFNLGLQEARGQYIGICEADDYILPEMYEKQYQIALENQLDVVRAGYYQIFHVNNKEYRFKLKSCYQDEWTEKVIVSNRNTFFLEQGVNGFWNGIYRRNFLLENHIGMNETKGAAYQDISFSFLVQMYAEKIWFMKEAFYCYRIDNLNASVNSLHGIEFHISEYEELKKRLKNSNQWEQYKNMFFSWELVSYRWFLGELPNDLKKDNAKKVYRILNGQNQEEKFDTKRVMETVKLFAETLDNETEFLQCILSGTENKIALLEYMETLLKKNEEIILFGVGHLGKIIRQFFALFRKEIFLTDNSKFLQSSGLMGEKIYHPEDMTRRFPHGRYIIASVNDAKEMNEQLIKLGIPGEKILICDDEEFFLRRIFVKAGKYGES